MAFINFGANQLNNPTPAKISRGLDIAAATTAAIGTWIGTAAFIPAALSTVLQSVCGLITTICLVVKPFFGVTDTGKKTVPIEDVTTMETPAKN